MMEEGKKNKDNHMTQTPAFFLFFFRMEGRRIHFSARLDFFVLLASQ